MPRTSKGDPSLEHPLCVLRDGRTARKKHKSRKHPERNEKAGQDETTGTTGPKGRRRRAHPGRRPHQSTNGNHQHKPHATHAHAHAPRDNRNRHEEARKQLKPRKTEPETRVDPTRLSRVSPAGQSRPTGLSRLVNPDRAVGGSARCVVPRACLATVDWSQALSSDEDEEEGHANSIVCAETTYTTVSSALWHYLARKAVGNTCRAAISLSFCPNGECNASAALVRGFLQRLFVSRSKVLSDLSC